MCHKLIIILVSMRVSDVMVKDLVMVGPETPVNEVAQLMNHRSVGSVILVKDDKPVGIVTERDLVRRVLAPGVNPKALTAWDICSKPVVAVHELGDVELAVDLMKDYKIRRMVVIDSKDRVVGILTTDDLVTNLRSMSEDLAVKYLTTVKRIESQQKR